MLNGYKGLLAILRPRAQGVDPRPARLIALRAADRRELELTHVFPPSPRGYRGRRRAP